MMEQLHSGASRYIETGIGKHDASMFEKYSSARNLNLIILPTEQCNFRCVYCYEDFLNAKKMDKTIVEGIENLIIARNGRGLDSISLAWFGGEPLMAYDNILQIMSCVNNVCNSTRTAISSNMTTNGYLLSLDVLSTLTKAGVTEYQISLDGDQEYHDGMRKRADGKGTFDRIWGNLIEAHKSDLQFKTTIRMHANMENAESIESLLRRAHIEVGSDERFSVFIRPLSRLGGGNDSELPVLDKAREERLASESTVAKLKSTTSELGLKLSQSNLSGYVCYASKLDALMIRRDGRIGKCTVALYDGKNTIGKLLNDGSVEIDKDKALWWARGLFSGDSAQLACPLHAK